ncbi:hypothetical protein PORY_000229 [Pneumocystis oryctolagi]|uniref:Uncharacterized protein n=1 Tax=Pneumocystis oryctolagi TaxID=42067 RepID=A0ACB7CEM0_9ASCO|nr:hypothetical protein PORY_000229 [Pneumocystis oryctolagi]
MFWVFILSVFYKIVFGDFQCSFEINKVSYDLRSLNRTSCVTSLYNLDESIVNMTWKISLCKGLNSSENTMEEYVCLNNPNICEIKTISNDGKVEVKSIRSLHFDVYSKYLTNSGFRIFFYNAQFRKSNLSAMIDFVCNSNEYNPEFMMYDHSHLQLRWKTKYACIHSKNQSIKEKKRSWSIFSYLFLIFLIIFSLCFIFNLYISYKRYGFMDYGFYSFVEIVNDFLYYFKNYASQIIYFIKQIKEPVYRELLYFSKKYILNMYKVTLMSSDNEKFVVDKVVAERSILIKNMLEDVGELDMPIPLPNVTSSVLKKPLLDVGCKTVANMIKNKTPEEIRKTESRYHDLLKYLDTDTILFFAPESESNGELLILQKKSWEPLHEWAQNYWKVDILKTFCDLGINFHFQPQKTKDKIISWMRSLDKWQFAALDRAVCVSKSFIIGAKMVVAENGPSDEYLSIEKICDLVQLELHFQISRWGKIKESKNFNKQIL